MIAPRCDVFWFSVTRRMGKGANAPCLRELKVRVRFASLSPPYSLRAAWNIAGRSGGRFQPISRKLWRAEQLLRISAALPGRGGMSDLSPLMGCKPENNARSEVCRS